MLRVALVCAALLVSASCAGGESREAGSGGETSTVVIETDSGQVSVDVEIADTPDERRVGLMHRESLAPRAGMLFVFPELREGGFWMKDTLIPLSIAYFDERGTILRILDMEPCRSDPCPVYDPGVAYAGALEVNQGAFARWGVAEGDVLELPAEAG